MIAVDGRKLRRKRPLDVEPAPPVNDDDYGVDELIVVPPSSSSRAKISRDLQTLDCVSPALMRVIMNHAQSAILKTPGDVSSLLGLNFRHFMLVEFTPHLGLQCGRVASVDRSACEPRLEDLLGSPSRFEGKLLGDILADHPFNFTPEALALMHAFNRGGLAPLSVQLGESEKMIPTVFGGVVLGRVRCGALIGADGYPKWIFMSPPEILDMSRAVAKYRSKKEDPRDRPMDVNTSEMTMMMEWETFPMLSDTWLDNDDDDDGLVGGTGGSFLARLQSFNFDYSNDSFDAAALALTPPALSPSADMLGSASLTPQNFTPFE